MLYIEHTSLDPYFNLALEEYLVSSDDEALSSSDIIMLWQNGPAVIVGKHQNTPYELDRGYLEARDIAAVRRLSGGGAVYHDLGNLNYTVIKRNAKERHNDFSFFTRPLVDALQSIGVNAEFSGRNDVVIEGAKFSGNAQYARGETVMHHGTILWDSDLSVLGRVLKPKKMRSTEEAKRVPGVSSTPRTVTNVSEHTDAPLADFKNLLARHLLDIPAGQGLELYQLSKTLLGEVEQLAHTKYRTIAWNWGRSPFYTHTFEKRFAAGTVMVGLSVNDGIIQDFDIYGDFFEIAGLEFLRAEFQGKPFADFKEIARGARPERFIHNFTGEDFATLSDSANKI